MLRPGQFNMFYFSYRVTYHKGKAWEPRWCVSHASVILVTILLPAYHQSYSSSISNENAIFLHALRPHASDYPKETVGTIRGSVGLTLIPPNTTRPNPLTVVHIATDAQPSRILAPLLLCFLTFFPPCPSPVRRFLSSIVKMRAAVSIRFSPSRRRILGNGCATGTVSMVTRRAFASSGSNLATWGLIGLGRMGKHSILS